MKCRDISSRLVDFLYEELPAAERAEFDEHLAGCPSCAAEVRASSRALQRTRDALRGPLNEEPPARVHANILAAARATQPTPARKPRVDEKEGFFARLWKAPWLIPAMGAAGVATAVFLIKVIKNPEVFPVREPASPALVGKPQATEMQAPQPAAAPVEPQVVPQAEAPLGADKDQKRTAPAAKRHQGSGLSRTSPSPHAATRMKRLTDDPLAGIRVEPESAAPMAEQRQAITEHALSSPKPAAAAARPLNASGAWAEPPPPRTLDDRNRRAGESAPLLKEDASGAGADQPRAELRVRPQKAEEAPRLAVPPPAARAFALPPAPAAAPAKAAAAKAAPEPSEVRGKAKKSLDLDSLDEVTAAAPQPTASADKEDERAEKRGSAHKDAFEESVRKADKLYNEHKWSEAAAAYRALLAQAPKHPSATIWHQRMVYAEQEQEKASSIRAKKAISRDPLDGI